MCYSSGALDDLGLQVRPGPLVTLVSETLHPESVVTKNFKGSTTVLLRPDLFFRRYDLVIKSFAPESWSS